MTSLLLQTDWKIYHEREDPRLFLVEGLHIDPDLLGLIWSEREDEKQVEELVEE